MSERQKLAMSRMVLMGLPYFLGGDEREVGEYRTWWRTRAAAFALWGGAYIW
jgi:hypothetical protein